MVLAGLNVDMKRQMETIYAHTNHLIDHLVIRPQLSSHFQMSPIIVNTKNRLSENKNEEPLISRANEHDMISELEKNLADSKSTGDKDKINMQQQAVVSTC